LFPFTKVGRADTVEQFLGRAHDQHPAHPAQARCPAADVGQSFFALGDRALIDDDRRVNVTVLAESHRPLLLFETALPVRYYLPPDDVRVELVPSQTRSVCPYKGVAA
jgi:hypothetical protein